MTEVIMVFIFYYRTRTDPAQQMGVIILLRPTYDKLFLFMELL